ncbi:unnamed protein product [Linum tenue]|uniref:Uncharacterized protein n=1 Tax=Linum tenue TaxID=586396 RepID=A0AAV0I1F5_9ROSI|nr:unnamed protein product [Linum tenue]
MTMQAEDPVPSPTAQLVGNAFVEQYYNMLSKSPDVVHKFYQDSSVMSRPVADGLMSSVSTMAGINQMILSLEYKDCEVQILTADSQKSFGDGVIVLVTGFLTAKDGLKRKFTQLFFLAPQDNAGFFVLNDVLRYVDEEELLAVKGSEVAADTAPVVTPEPEPTPFTNHVVVEQETATVSAEDTIPVSNEASLQLDNGDIAVAEKDYVSNSVAEAAEIVAAIPKAEVATQEANHHQLSETAATPTATEDAPKKSYASIANQLNYKPQPFQQRIAPPKPVVLAPVAAAAPAAAPTDAPAPRPARNNSVERNNNFTGKGHPIFVANLPMDATPEQLYEIFEKFGPIKSGGVQVRSYKQEKNCFGFVDFESASSMEKALEAGTMMIGNREAHIEKKKAAGEAGKFAPRRGGYRNDGFRGRGGSFVGGRGGGYGKGEFENQQGGGNFSGHARGGGAGRNGEAKVYQNGGVRGARQTRPAPPAAGATPAAAGAVLGGKN